MKINEKWLAAHGLTQADIDAGRAQAPPIMGGAPDDPSGGPGDYNTGETGEPTGRRWGRPPTPPAPSPIDLELQSLIELIRGKDGQGGQLAGFQDAVDRLHGIATGQGDPALAFEESRALGGVAEQFGRRGLGFSGASVNAANQLRASFGGQRMARRDAALEQELNTRSALIETASTPAELLIAKLAAEKAGTVPPDSGGGCSIICLVLTDELLCAGDLSPALYFANARWAASRTTPEMYRGYCLWALPLRTAMRRWAHVRAVVGWAVNRYCQEAAAQLGMGGRSTWLGNLLLAAVPAFSSLLARALPAHGRERPISPIYKEG